MCMHLRILCVSVCVLAAGECFPFCVLGLELACQSQYRGEEWETTGVGERGRKEKREHERDG